MRSKASLGFRACGPTVTVSVRPPSLANDVRRLFPDYATASVSADRANAQLVVARSENGYEVRWDGRRETTEHWIDALAEGEAALATLLLRGCADQFHVHAGGCVIDRRAILVLGGPAAGKSSLTAAWSAAGVPVLGDDVVLLDRRGRFAPFKRPIKVAATLLPVIAVQPTRTLFWTPGSEEAWLDPALGGGWASPTPPGVLAVVRYAVGASWQVRDINRREALSRLLHSLFPSGRRAATGFEVLADTVSACRTVEVRFGSAPQAAGALAALVP